MGLGGAAFLQRNEMLPLNHRYLILMHILRESDPAFLNRTLESTKPEQP